MLHPKQSFHLQEPQVPHHSAGRRIFQGHHPARHGRLHGAPNIHGCFPNWKNGDLPLPCWRLTGAPHAEELAGAGSIQLSHCFLAIWKHQSDLGLWSVCCIYRRMSHDRTCFMTRNVIRRGDLLQALKSASSQNNPFPL